IAVLTISVIYFRIAVEPRADGSAGQGGSDHDLCCLDPSALASGGGRCPLTGRAITRSAAKPPKEHRFKKGNNANARGRPRGSKNLRTLLQDALDTPVVDKSGAPDRLTKRDMVIAQLVDLSAKADLRAAKMLLDMLDKPERRAAPGS